MEMAIEIQEAIQEMTKEFKKSMGELDDIRGRFENAHGHLTEKARAEALAHLNGQRASDGMQGRSGGANHLDLGIRALCKGEQGIATQHFMEVRTMTAGIDDAGGYLVIPSFATAINRVMLEAAPFIALPRTIEITGDSYQEPSDHSTLTASWVGETSSRATTGTPILGLANIILQELYAMPSLSQKLIDVSAFDVVAWLSSKVGEQFGKSEEQAFISGDGVAKPTGILSYVSVATGDATRPWGQIENVVSGAATGITPDALIQLKSKLKGQYRTNAQWVMNRDTVSQVERLKDGEGRYLWAPGIAAGAPDTLLGYPIALCEQMPNVGAGTYPLMLGDFGQAYTIVRNKGLKMLADPYTNKGYVNLYCTERVGGQVTNFEAVKLMKISA